MFGELLGMGHLLGMYGVMGGRNVLVCFSKKPLPQDRTRQFLRLVPTIGVSLLFPTIRAAKYLYFILRIG